MMSNWIKRELDNPADEGGRNQQMIRIGPTLMRDHGYTFDSLVELFQGMFPELGEREITTTCRSAARYAAQEGHDRLSKSVYIARCRHLKRIESMASRQLPVVLKDFLWPLGDISDIQPELKEMAGVEQRRLFLSTMFGPDDVLWIGNVFQSGERYRHLFKTRDGWLEQPCIRGEFTSHCTFKHGTTSRCNEAVADRRYLVVESDRLTLDQSGAIFNWLATDGKLNLRAIVFSGGKSIHGWFDWPQGADFEELCAMLRGLSCDPATPRASQPVRLPGCIRHDSKKLQSLLLLN